ncbi:hypothetical protein SERLADRAFT_409049 [Serpula lacrymans var. lacrymans S7.9]|uniref:Uncharacterized protein n=1 Tax=Serpula lacrymans var. lacrymans (strain S7.9) TaxID=578457 RepID=F8NYV6_SERL9|nr:uncharacterized protein SERLADRAFT_409049 [Serpula lacrymans var. lacrymans S7.9]EGO23777.1 hypothetical protein SERLADRAFT_409049 [Serpula lacrymans var. lacrymans S7.9]
MLRCQASAVYAPAGQELWECLALSTSEIELAGVKAESNPYHLLDGQDVVDLCLQVTKISATFLRLNPPVKILPFKRPKRMTAVIIPAPHKASVHCQGRAHESFKLHIILPNSIQHSSEANMAKQEKDEVIEVVDPWVKTLQQDGLRFRIKDSWLIKGQVCVGRGEVSAMAQHQYLQPSGCHQCPNNPGPLCQRTTISRNDLIIVSKNSAAGPGLFATKTPRSNANNQLSDLQ